MCKTFRDILIIIAVSLPMTLCDGNAQEKVSRQNDSVATKGVYFVDKEEIQSHEDGVNLEVLSTIHKVAIPPELIEKTPRENRAKLGEEQFLFRLKITNLSEKPVYFNALRASMHLRGNSAIKSITRLHPSMNQSLEPYDLKSFKPHGKQRIVAWKLKSKESMIISMNSDGDPYLFTGADNTSSFTLYLMVQMDGDYVGSLVTKLPVLQDLELESPNELGSGTRVEFEMLELQKSGNRY